MKKKLITWITIAILLLALSYVAGWLLGPGSYPRAEIYEFNIREDSLISIINKVKNENPELTLNQKVSVQTGGKFDLKDGRAESTSFWYHVYFYYPDKNQIVHTWTRPKGKYSTTFAVVGVNNGLILGNWKKANESFWWWKNKPAKKEFEERILKLLQ